MKPLGRYFILLGLALTCLACADHKASGPLEHLPPPDQTQSTLPAIDHSFLTDTRKIIVQAAVESIGIPYRWGGHAPGRGFDCSGLVLYTHQTAGIQVPRTAHAQFSQGRKIPRHQLVPGDLVFFTVPEKKNGFHVGIYTGSSWFIHAPGRGRRVMHSHLDNPYFKKNYTGARSYL